MRATIFLIAVVLTASILAPAGAQMVTIPAGRVVPVCLNNGLNSFASKVDDTFTATITRNYTGGFPCDTQFTGVVTGVYLQCGCWPGQIAVKFTQAKLPDGTTVDIDGALTSLDVNDTVYDPQTCTMTALEARMCAPRAFIAYGDRAGVLIGAFCENSVVGATICPKQGWVDKGPISRNYLRDVDVAPGTVVGVMLRAPVQLGAVQGAGPAEGSEGDQPMQSPQASQPTQPSQPGAGPAVVQVVVLSQQPYELSDGTLMVPFKTSLVALKMPYVYDPATKTVQVDTPSGRLVHPIGTNMAVLNGEAIALAVPSRVENGNLYVPAAVITRVSARQSVIWDPMTNTLTIR